MPAALRRSFSGASITNNATVAAEAGGIAPGDLVVVGAVRSVGSISGVSSVTDSDGNAYDENDTIAQRASTLEATLSHGTITDALESGDTITATFPSVGTRKLLGGLAFSGLTGALNARSNATPISGGTGASGGPNGTTSAVSASCTTTVADCLLVAVVGFTGQGTTVTPAAGWTAGPVLATQQTSAERNLAMFWKVVTAPGPQTFTGSLSAGSWAAGLAAYPIAADPEPGGLGQVVVGGTKRATVGTGYFVLDGVKRPVVRAWEVIDGVKQLLK